MAIKGPSIQHSFDSSVNQANSDQLNSDLLPFDAPRGSAGDEPLYVDKKDGLIARDLDTTA